MKAVGVVRKVDDLGRLVIPKEIRETHGIPEGTAMEFYVTNDSIVIKKYAPGCSECGRDDTGELIGKTKICRPCAKRLAESTAYLVGGNRID